VKKNFRGSLNKQKQVKLEEEFKNNLQTLNQAQSYCYKFEKQIEDFKNHKDFKEFVPQLPEFKNLYNNPKEATSENNYAKLTKKKKIR
jgi:hypothetical protein